MFIFLLKHNVKQLYTMNNIFIYNIIIYSDKAFVRTKYYVWRQNKDYVEGATCDPPINYLTCIIAPWSLVFNKPANPEALYQFITQLRKYKLKVCLDATAADTTASELLLCSSWFILKPWDVVTSSIKIFQSLVCFLFNKFVSSKILFIFNTIETG